MDKLIIKDYITGETVATFSAISIHPNQSNGFYLFSKEPAAWYEFDALVHCAPGHYAVLERESE